MIWRLKGRFPFQFVLTSSPIDSLGHLRGAHRSQIINSHCAPYEYHQRNGAVGTTSFAHQVEPDCATPKFPLLALRNGNCGPSNRGFAVARFIITCGELCHPETYSIYERHSQRYFGSSNEMGITPRSRSRAGRACHPSLRHKS